MAVLNPASLAELLPLLRQSPPEYWLRDREGLLSFAELANAASKSSLPDGQGLRVLLEATHTRYFLARLLALSSAGHLALIIPPDLPQEKLFALADQFGAHGLVRTRHQEDEWIPLYPKRAGAIPGYALALLTSGSTGEPKAVVLTQAQVLANARAVIATMNLADPGRVAVLLPLHHSFALVTQVLTTLLTGGRLLLAPDTAWPGELLALIRAEQVETLAGVPATFRLMLMGNQDTFPAVRHITVAGAALDAGLVEELYAAFPRAEIWIGYGLTEAGPRVTAISSRDALFCAGSVGKPIAGVRLRIEQGEVLVSSPSTMLGYLDDTDGTAVRLSQGWLHTGDLGWLDEQGYLFIAGRQDDIFISGGEKIAPLEIERILGQHPALQAAAVCGAPDPILGLQIIALVQLRPGRLPSRHELLEHCRAWLERHQVPHQFFLVDSLPCTPNGKLKRQELPTWPRLALSTKSS